MRVNEPTVRAAMAAAERLGYEMTFVVPHPRALCEKSVVMSDAPGYDSCVEAELSYDGKELGHHVWTVTQSQVAFRRRLLHAARTHSTEALSAASANERSE